MEHVLSKGSAEVSPGPDPAAGFDDLEFFFSTSLDLLCISDEKGRFLRLSPEWERTLGHSLPELIGRRAIEFMHPEDVDAAKAAAAGLRGEGAIVDHTVRYRHKDGSFRWLDWRARAVKDRIYASARDVTDRLEGERQRRLQEAALRAAANAIVITDRAGVIQWTNPAFSDVTGYPAEEAFGRTPGALLRSGEHGPAFYREMWETILGGRVWQGETVNQRKDGSRYVEEQTITPVADRTGSITHFVAIKQDATERKRVAEALRKSEARYHGVFRDSHAVMLLVDPEDRVILEANPAAGVYYGLPVDHLEGMKLTEIEVTPIEDVAEGEDGGSGGEDRGSGPDPRPARHRVAEGKVREVEVYSGPVEVEGKSLIYAIVHDVTDRVRTEAQLRQAQKMESVGRLAGGVAHDFNNILTVINATAELAAETLGPDHPLREELGEIREAGRRAAALTRQLLTFSRQEITRRRIMDLNTVVEGMDRLLRRVIGEDVEMRFRPDPDLRAVRVDPGHMEQVIMNLAVNARDAMPGGGALTIETANAEVDEITALVRPNLSPGSYVVLSVCDTGVGMDRETQDRMFEPFFSTKPADRGTGLGLSTVYGIVRESEGEIVVYSEPGAGTTLRVYLPALDTMRRTEVSPAKPQLERGSETILLVEDDSAVRSVTARVLRAAGYRVIDAENGAKALTRFRNGSGPVDLVLTDLVMPGISGHELAQELQAEAPGMKFLFTSGHTADALVRRKVDERHLHFVGKPFTAAELTRSVRKALDGR
jgi:two-component system, cell cycle sensor histidine kinase and response regulator CckA